jgi:hypothetical protein
VADLIRSLKINPQPSAWCSGRHQADWDARYASSFSADFSFNGNSCHSGIVKLTGFMEISLITMPAKLLILGSGKNRFPSKMNKFELT